MGYLKYFFLFGHFLGDRAEICRFFRWQKIHSEIIWSLESRNTLESISTTSGHNLELEKKKKVRYTLGTK